MSEAAKRAATADVTTNTSTSAATAFRPCGTTDVPGMGNLPAAAPTPHRGWWPWDCGCGSYGAGDITEYRLVFDNYC